MRRGEIWWTSPPVTGSPEGHNIGTCPGLPWVLPMSGVRFRSSVRLFTGGMPMLRRPRTKRRATQRIAPEFGFW
jgi:hypothetical protein